MFLGLIFFNLWSIEFAVCFLQIIPPNAQQRIGSTGVGLRLALEEEFEFRSDLHQELIKRWIKIFSEVVSL